MAIEIKFIKVNKDNYINLDSISKIKDEIQEGSDQHIVRIFFSSDTPEVKLNNSDAIKFIEFMESYAYILKE